MIFENFLPLTLETKSLYDRSIAEMRCSFPSSIQFPGLYAYNQTSISRYRFIEDYLCFVVNDTWSEEYLAVPPMGAYEPHRYECAVAELYALFRRNGLPLVFCEVPLGLLDQFTSLRGFDAQVRHSVESSDYVFSRDAFADGLNKHSARQALRHFESHLQPECHRVTSRSASLLLDMTRQYFCAHHSCSDCVYGCELDIVSRYMEAFEALDLQGVVAHGGGRALGYLVAFAERDTVFAFSKRVRHGVRGLNEYLNKHLLDLFGGRFRWVNYSEDMGIEGLRFYKQRLGQHRLHHRFRVTMIPTHTRKG